MSKYSKFILTPITTILDEAISIVSAIEWNMKSFSLAEYVLHSLFLKMTGAQEQKFKCLIWEIGTENLEFRNKQIYDKKWEYGECSKLDVKNQIITELYMCVKDNQWNKEQNIITENDRAEIYNNAKQAVISLYEKALKYSVFQKEYNDFINTWGNTLPIDTYLLEEDFKLIPVKKKDNISKSKSRDLVSFVDVYKNLYDYRNFCAHNFKIFQTNCYSFDKMRKKENITNNYFFYFALLIVIDSFVMFLYQHFIEEFS